MAAARKKKAGRPRDPAYESAGSVAFARWVDTVGVKDAAKLLNCSRQTVWSWCVAECRPSGCFQEQILEHADIPYGDWRRPT